MYTINPVFTGLKDKLDTDKLTEPYSYSKIEKYNLLGPTAKKLLIKLYGNLYDYANNNHPLEGVIIEYDNNIGDSIATLDISQFFGLIVTQSYMVEPEVILGEKLYLLIDKINKYKLTNIEIGKFLDMRKNKFHDLMYKIGKETTDYDYYDRFNILLDNLSLIRDLDYF